MPHKDERSQHGVTNSELTLDIDTTVGTDGATLAEIMLTESLEVRNIRSGSVMLESAESLQHVIVSVGIPPELIVAFATGMAQKAGEFAVVFLKEYFRRIAAALPKLSKETNYKASMDIRILSNDKHDPLYHIPGMDELEAIASIPDDLPESLTAVVLERHRFWVGGEWMPGHDEYWAYKKKHQRGSRAFPPALAPAAISKAIPEGVPIYPCSNVPDIFIDRAGFDRERTMTLLLSLRSALASSGRAGLWSEDRRYIHVRFNK